MPKRLELELRDLKERFGIALGDLDADELEKFVLACRRIENPFSTVNMELIERPIRICEGVYGWTMTAGALVWIMEYAQKWWADGTMYKWAQVYAMIHAREADAFTSLTTKSAARKAILKTVLRLACHRRELQDALLKAYNVGEDLTEKQELTAREMNAAQVDYASLIARLEVHSGIPAAVWLWEKTFVQTMRCYADLHAFAAAFSMCERKHMCDELDEAVNDLARLKMEILRHHQAKTKDEKVASAT